MLFLQRLACIEIEEMWVQRLCRGFIMWVVVRLEGSAIEEGNISGDRQTCMYGCRKASSTLIRRFGLKVKHFSIRSIACCIEIKNEQRKKRNIKDTLTSGLASGNS